MKNRKLRGFLFAVCGMIVLGLYGGAVSRPAFAAAVTDTEKKEDEKKDPYALDKEVKDWLDGGGGIPGEVKYATLSGTGHLWELDSTDISDGKVELIGVNEKRLVYGIELKNWLKNQFFYGDRLGEEDNRVKFKRPKKDYEF